MGQDTTPIFVIGSGRSGTRMIFKLLSGIEHIEIYHEYLCTHIQPAAALYSMNRMPKEEAKQRIMALHGAAIEYSEARYFVDCSNKLSWLIEPIWELFPGVKFVHLIRDGRKVASSYFHKLSHEMYDDRSVRLLDRWLKAPGKWPMPPPEKKYWWKIPQKGQPNNEEFPGYDQFQRASYHWAESNREISAALENIPGEQKLFIKLEELVTDTDELKRFLLFFDVDFKDNFFEFLQSPQGVIFPMDFKLNETQINQFNAIAGEMMEKYGYAETDEYTVNY